MVKGGLLSYCSEHQFVHIAKPEISLEVGCTKVLNFHFDRQHHLRILPGFFVFPLQGVTFGASVKARASGPAPPPSSTTFSTAVNKSQSATSSSSGAGGVASLGTTPLPLSPVLEGNVLTSNQNAENMQGVGQREGVVSEGRGSSENVKKEVGEGEELERSIQEALAAQQLLEKAAMSGISEW